MPRPVVTQQRAVARAPAARTAGDPWGSATRGLRVLVYGQSGSGKTTFAGSFPGPTLWLLCSGAVRTGELLSLDTPEFREKITPVEVTDTAQLRGLLADAGKYTTVVLDHASGLADLILKEILGLAELPAQKGWGLASQQQYGQQSMQLKEFLRTMLGAAGNTVVIAQERTFNARDGDVGSSDPGALDLKPTVGAALTPSVTGWLAPACDYVVQTFKRTRVVREPILLGGNPTGTFRERKAGVEYCLRTGPHEIYQTKFRVPKGRPLPDVIVDPDHAKLVAVINGTFGG